jgi:aspartate aminotransferase
VQTGSIDRPHHEPSRRSPSSTAGQNAQANPVTPIAGAPGEPPPGLAIVAPVHDDGRVMISTRVAETLLGDKESWTRRMFEQAAALRRAGGGPVHDLSLGNPSLEPPLGFTRALHELLRDPTPGMHRYMTNAGFPAVREHLARREGERFDLPIDAGLVVMTAGASGGLNVVLRAVVDPGDEVVTPVPCFTEYEHYSANVGAALVPVPAGPGFCLDVDAIAARLRPRTRIVLLNSPNNPTGAVYDDDALDRLARALRAATMGRPILVVEDSPYRDLAHDGRTIPSMMTRYEHTIHVTSHSKDLGLAGERIGYVVISPRAAGAALLARALAFCNRVLGFGNAPALMQRMLPLVLDQPDGRVDVGIYARRCHRMAEGLRRLGFGVPVPTAGFFLFPALPAPLRTAGVDAPGGDVALAERLLAERTIVVPGTAFGVPDHLRLSMTADDDDIEGALAAFERVCR